MYLNTAQRCWVTGIRSWMTSAKQLVQPEGGCQVRPVVNRMLEGDGAGAPAGVLRRFKFNDPCVDGVALFESLHVARVLLAPLFPPPLGELRRSNNEGHDRC